MSEKKVQVGNVVCGDDPLFLISGPCVIETEKIALETAETLKRVSEELNIPVIYKSSFQKDNRSSVDYYMGPGLDEGLRILQKVKDVFGFPLLTDIHYPEQVKPVAEVVDVLQIPAYLVMQTTLTVESAKTGKAINLKHGQFLAPENMVKPVAKVESTGNRNIILTERGYTFGYNDLVVDPRSFHHMRETGYPVVFDITHSIRKYGIPSADPAGGARQYLGVLGRAGVAAGVDGVFIETHPCPNEALCDAASQMDMTELRDFMLPLLELHETELKYRK
ncbi:MAG TPA: 3-deoxy-8-phosphooctulonate synthase [Flavobacteriales bacterium]|jgi:2-dehydro-3-deoxyphosphooctonate aldolase (KDO 8-P synthase)|nr:3-deoxy-8-phosphooctulonate synthase [Flavobacteriales bacterium]